MRLALDGKLQLSVYFVNYARARYGRVVGIADVDWGEFTANQASKLAGLPEGSTSQPLPYIRSLKIDEERFLNLSDEVETLKGVWDLPMIGNESMDVEHRYQFLTDGPEVTLQGLDGAFVSRGDDVICQLQEDFEDNPYQRGSKAAGDQLEQHIADSELDEEEAEALRKKFNEDRKNYLEDRRSQPQKNRYYPAGALPDDAVFVVRTASIKAFEQSFCRAPEKEIGSRERDTLYKIIIGMAIGGYRYNPALKRNEAIADIARDLELVGVTVSDDTIRKYIKEAADLIPQGREKS